MSFWGSGNETKCWDYDKGDYYPRKPNRRDKMIIDLKSNKRTEINKEKEWAAIGKKYKADTLEVLTEDEDFPDESTITANYGYHLEWKTKEDHIHVFGDGAGNMKDAAVFIDSRTYLKESLNRLTNAVACAKEINANHKKYF